MFYTYLSEPGIFLGRIDLILFQCKAFRTLIVALLVVIRLKERLHDVLYSMNSAMSRYVFL